MEKQKTKFKREDDPVLQASVEYTNYLIDAYKQTEDPTYREALIGEFDWYLRKYVNILYKNGGTVDIENKDTKALIRMLMPREGLLGEKPYKSSASLCIHNIRRTMDSFDKEDIYHEIMVIFLAAAENYKPITYKRKNQKYRISFAHYIQVLIRCGIVNLIKSINKDILTGTPCLEYSDDIEGNHCTFPVFNYPEVSLDDWVWGKEARFPFSGLEEAERYLLWLKYNSSPSGKELTTKEVGDIVGFHERTIIYRLKKIKRKLKDLVLNEGRTIQNDLSKLRIS